MSESRWVQHISGHGEKWELDGTRPSEYESDYDWCVKAKHRDPKCTRHWLPKSEYVLCDPPERWVDVTKECQMTVEGYVMHNGFHTNQSNGFRVRKIELDGQSYLIVEKKVQG